MAATADDNRPTMVGDGDELRDRPEELDLRPEAHDVVGGTEEQALGRHRGGAGHQPPQLANLAPQRHLHRTPPAAAAAVARRAATPPLLHVRASAR